MTLWPLSRIPHTRSLPRGHGRHQVWALYTVGEEKVKESLLSRHWTRLRAQWTANLLNRDPAITREMFDATRNGVPLVLECEVR